MSDSGPSLMPKIMISEKENDLCHLAEDVPVQKVGNLFADVLTVPQELRQKIFYWPEERKFCEHISSIGKALDTSTSVHKIFLGQFKLLSSLRATLIQAPTGFFVAPMYFCDSALDSLLRSIQKVQNDINELFKNLGHLETECLWRYRWTKRAFLEDMYPKDTATRDEPTRRPDTEIKEQRVNLLAELSERISMVKRGGPNMLSLHDRQWLSGYTQNRAIRRPEDIVMKTVTDVKALQKDPFIDKGNSEAQLEIEGNGSNGSLATPTRQRRGSIRSQEKDCENPAEVPETPEAPRIECAVATQRSSPKKRKRSQSSGRSDATDSAKYVQTVVRNLLGDGSADLQDSPAQKSGASIEAIRAVSQTEGDAAVACSRADTHNLQVDNQIVLRLPRGDTDRPTLRQELPSSTGVVFHNQPQDQEKHDEEKVRSLSI